MIMKKLIKLLTLIIILSVLFISSASAEEGEHHVRVRIRYPRLFNEQVSFEGYNEITIYDQV